MFQRTYHPEPEPARTSAPAAPAAPAAPPAPLPDPYHVPHRKNAAEWVMWLALRPLVPIARLIERVRRPAKETPHG